MYTGYPEEWYPRIKALAELPHKTKIFVAGNHDLHLQNYAGPALQEMRKAGIEVLGEPSKHSVIKLENGMTVLGLPYVTNLPQWAFNRGEEWISDYLDQIGRVDIVVSHSPPRGIMDGDNYGIAAYRRYLKRFQPDHWICGHVHEDYGLAAQDGCLFYNVCMCNEDYKMLNKAMEIEV